MRRNHRRLTVTAVAAVLLLSACAEAPSDEHVIDEPATVEQVEGTDIARVTMTQRAAERLDIHTQPVTRAGATSVVPSSAVLVDPNGHFWVYTNTDHLLFVRHEISIDRDDGEQAYLSDGPPVGTPVVSVGAAELYGAEHGIGH